jgi:small subunit ribosomal protein S20
MANTQSAIKAARKTVRLTLRNKGAKTRIKTLRKSFDAAVKSGDAAASKKAGIAFLSAMDRAVKSGVVHRNAASRAKSHAAKYVLAK